MKLVLYNSTFKCLAISVKSSNSKIILVSIYISPNSPTEIYKRYCIDIKKFVSTFSEQTFIIVDD